MTERIQTAMLLPTALESRLCGEDDAGLWWRVLMTVADDDAALEIRQPCLYAEVGACSHWLRPHQTRWTAAGGFAYPVGYGDGAAFGRAGLPGFDWSVRLLFSPTSLAWEVPPTIPAKRFRSVRIAIPARTTRHPQAAVHTIWPAGTLDARQKRTVFYGFRNVDGVWELKARSKEF